MKPGTPSADCNQAFYKEALGILDRSKIPFLVGGGFAFECYSGIHRGTKDLDVFIRPGSIREVLRTFSRHGFETELTFPHWLGKVRAGGGYMDVIFSSGNGVATVDDEWFAHAPAARILDVAVRLCPVEEMIWMKSYVMERERFEGADVIHLIHAQGERLDWNRLLRRFGAHPRVLLAHLILFGFVYPAERAPVPDAVLSQLLRRLDEVGKDGGRPLCQGTLLSRVQYSSDLAAGYEDARLGPTASMTPEQIEEWTRAGLEEPGSQG